jgi:hypothetical protein
MAVHPRGVKEDVLMNNTHRWIAFVGALLLALTVGFAAWQAGVAHGVELSGKIVAPPAGPYPYPYYGWHRPWGGGFLFVPLFFAFWFFVARGIFWRRAWHGGYGGACGPRGRFDEWHRQAHAQDGPATPPTATER